MKCVMIIDADLELGLIANTAAALGVSISNAVKSLVGEAVIDGEGRVHRGITKVPLPILTLPKDEIKAIYNARLSDADHDLIIIGFSDVAQQSNCYDNYEELISERTADDLNYLGICLYGPKKKVNKLTGSIRMLR